MSGKGGGGGTSVHRLKKDHSTKTTACSRAPREEKNRVTNKKQQQQQKLTLEVKVYSIPETSVFQIEIRTFSVWMVKSRKQKSYHLHRSLG